MEIVGAHCFKTHQKEPERARKSTNLKIKGTANPVQYICMLRNQPIKNKRSRDICNLPNQMKKIFFCSVIVS